MESYVCDPYIVLEINAQPMGHIKAVEERKNNHIKKEWAKEDFINSLTSLRINHYRYY